MGIWSIIFGKQESNKEVVAKSEFMYMQSSLNKINMQLDKVEQLKDPTSIKISINKLKDSLEDIRKKFSLLNQGQIRALSGLFKRAEERIANLE